MSWNYRIIRDKQADGSYWLAVHEVFYEADGTPTSCTKEPISVEGETVEELSTGT
jgi:hypothetical protein